MVRAPYPARIAAGLIVTALEETRKLPALIVTFPMTAVSQTLQVGMRAQQNIAELAIKGDAALELIFDKPADHPTWARFDEDEIDVPEPAPATPIETGDTDPRSGSASDTAPAAATSTGTPAKDAPRKTAAPKTPAQKTPASKATASKATAQKIPASKKAATKKAAKKSATAPATEPTPKPAGGDRSPGAPAPRADAGRFALYSSAPDDVISDVAADTAATPAPSGTAPEIVEYIEYDSLTLAQLRAKLRSVGADDLAALADYEKAHRNRAPFVTMLDNRITAAQNKRPPTT